VTSGPFGTKAQSSYAAFGTELPAATRALSLKLGWGEAPRKLIDVSTLFEGSSVSSPEDVFVSVIFSCDPETHSKLASADLPALHPVPTYWQSTRPWASGARSSTTMSKAHRESETLRMFRPPALPP
jgi:hypothetical protein